MKVHELITRLTAELNPDEEIIALIYHKSMFPDPDGLTLTDEAWCAVADNFYKHYDDSDTYASISEACIDESEETA